MKSLEEKSRSSAELGLTGGTLLTSLLRRRVFSVASKITEDHLVLVEGGETYQFGTRKTGSLRATVRVHDPRFYQAVVMLGSVGAGRTYMEGKWDTDNLTDLVRIFARSRRLMDSLDRGVARFAEPLLRSFHWLRRNTRSGSRRNIQDHYDLGNNFFSLFLDDSMMYSAAFFETEAASLHEASLAKIDRICRKLDLTPTDHLLEIGTGWGGFAVRAAAEWGCRVTTTTVSEEQYQLARERVAKAGLQDRVTVVLEDYRDLTGDYDKLVSIEMIEAVGYDYLETYFRKCDSLMKPGGRFVLQAITVAEAFFETARRSVDFVKRYVFPGSDLPAVSLLQKVVRSSTNLKWTEVEDITPHYARTLRLWRENFVENLDAIRRLGYSERFIRMWEFYLSYCEAGFLERHIEDIQLTLTKP